MMLSSSFSCIDSSGAPGDPIGLTSCTVSRVDVLPPPPRAGVLMPVARWSSASVSDGKSAGGCNGGVARWTLIRGVSGSGLRGSPMFGLLRMGGGDRNLGETGHLGDSRRCSMVVGDLTGAPTFELKSDADGRSVGVLADDRVLDAGAGAGFACFADREGLRSCWLFFLERSPEFADEVCEVAVRDSGLVGEGSREDGTGDGAADDEADVADAWEVNLEGPDSVIGVIVAVLAEDSRENVGCAFREPFGASDEPTDMFGDLSMSACEHWHWLDWMEGEEWRLGPGHTCHAWSLGVESGLTVPGPTNHASRPQHATGAIVQLLGFVRCVVRRCLGVGMLMSGCPQCCVITRRTLREGIGWIERYQEILIC
jgi:hypothetical protein